MPVTFYTKTDMEKLKKQLKTYESVVRGRLEQIRIRASKYMKEVYKYMGNRDSWKYEKNKFTKLNKNDNYDTPTAYRFIQFTRYLSVLEVISHIISKLEKSQGKDHRYIEDIRFVDAGAGIGNMVELAYLAGLTPCNISGFELDIEAIKIGNAYFKEMWERDIKPIKEQDILTANYAKYDIIYYYHPFNNKELEKQFEEYVEDNMAVGAYLIFSMKSSERYKTDARFIRMKSPNGDHYGINVLKKISNEIVVAKEKK